MIHSAIYGVELAALERKPAFEGVLLYRIYQVILTAKHEIFAVWFTPAIDCFAARREMLHQDMFSFFLPIAAIHSCGKLIATAFRIQLALNCRILGEMHISQALFVDICSSKLQLDLSYSAVLRHGNYLALTHCCLYDLIFELFHRQRLGWLLLFLSIFLLSLFGWKHTLDVWFERSWDDIVHAGLQARFERRCILISLRLHQLVTHVSCS
mmetsp:Transcript_16692/g.23349  ORF Transcript_16692/g.23349 Transcript_16692/m.23349 type:complete len:211 (+) Transcript_16692:820-1452(+)